MNPRERNREFGDYEQRAQALRMRQLYHLQERRRKRKRKMCAAFAALALVLGVGVAFAATSGSFSPTPPPQPQDAPQEGGHEQAHDNKDAVSTSQASVSATSAAPTDARSAEMALDAGRNSGWRTETDGAKKVFLTFDDGPSENTERILNILAQSDVKATFFVTGHSPDKFHLIKKEWDAGHSVGMHSYSHNYAEIYTSTSAYKADLEKIGNVIKDQIGFTPFLFRFPGGSSNEVSAKYSQGIMSTLTSELEAAGYQYYDWNISSGDAGADDIPSSDIIANSCQEGWTNIMLLMHDTDAKNTTVEALGHIIKFYKDRGYTFCAIDRSSFAVHHRVAN